MAKTAGEEIATQELRNRVEIQRAKYRQTIPVVVELAAAGTPGAEVPLVVKMSTEGDFELTHITGKIVGIDPVGGLPVDPTTFGGTGVTVALSESGWGRKLFRDATALEDIAVPGYGIIVYQPFPFQQILLQNSELTFDFRNSAPVIQRVKLALHGYQYRASFVTVARQG